MKRKYINIGILILCAISVVLIYIYDIFVHGTAYTERLFRVICILCSIVAVYVRSNKRLMERSFQNYENAYARLIGNAFCDNPKSKRILFLGIYDYNNGKYKRAIKRLSKLCQENLKNSEAVPCMIFTALSYEEWGHEQEAIETYKKVLKLAPQNETANNNIALLYSSEGNAEKALEHYGRAIETNPDYEQAYFNRAQLYIESHRLDEAIQDAQKVLDINNDNRGAVFLLLIACKLRGDVENAKRYYNKALALGYDSEMLDEEIELYCEDYEENGEQV